MPLAPLRNILQHTGDTSVAFFLANPRDILQLKIQTANASLHTDNFLSIQNNFWHSITTILSFNKTISSFRLLKKNHLSINAYSLHHQKVIIHHPFLLCTPLPKWQQGGTSSLPHINFIYWHVQCLKATATEIYMTVCPSHRWDRHHFFCIKK